MLVNFLGMICRKEIEFIYILSKWRTSVHSFAFTNCQRSRRLDLLFLFSLDRRFRADQKLILVAASRFQKSYRWAHPAAQAPIGLEAPFPPRHPRARAPRASARAVERENVNSAKSVTPCGRTNLLVVQASCWWVQHFLMDSGCWIRYCEISAGLLEHTELTESCGIQFWILGNY